MLIEMCKCANAALHVKSRTPTFSCPVRPAQRGCLGRVRRTSRRDPAERSSAPPGTNPPGPPTFQAGEFNLAGKIVGGAMIICTPP